MQTQFDFQLDKLKKRITDMGELANRQLYIASRFLLYGEKDVADALMNNEYRIDELDVKVDNLCQQILALRQPVASDLRFIMSSLRIGNELERVGDIALSIYNKAETVREQPDIIVKFNIEQLLHKAIILIREAFDNYMDFNPDVIIRIIADAHNLKEKCQVVLNEIIMEMTNKSEVILVATNLILILRQMERLSNHSANLAESIYFMKKGNIIKHSKNPGQEGKIS